jgi:hypothetical protein
MAARTGSQLDQVRSHAARNRWVLSRAELRALGCPNRRIDGWLESKRLVPLFRGVYAFGRDIETADAAWRAALLASAPGAVLAGRTACELWGLVRKAEGIPTRIQVAAEITEPALYDGRSPALARTRVRAVRRKLERSDVRWLGGLPVLSAPQAVIDYSAAADSVSVKFAFLEACRLGQFGRPDVDRCFKRIQGRRGASKVRPLLELWVPELSKTRSALEGLFLLTWVAADKRIPRINQKVFGFEVDCYWPEQRLIVELDGNGYHSDSLARERDAQKERALTNEGLRVVRFGYPEVRHHPERVVREVIRLLNGA